MNPQVKLPEPPVSTLPVSVRRHPAELRMLATEWERIDRLLVVRLDNIGDVLLTSPTLRALKQLRPELHLTLLASPAGAHAGQLLPEVDDILAFQAPWQDTGGTLGDGFAIAALLQKLSEGAFDAALILTSFSQTPHPIALACLLAGIPRRIAQSKEFGGSLLTHWVTPPADGVHQADRNLYLLETAGVPVADHDLAVVVPTEARLSVDALLASHGLGARPLVLGVPGASCSARRYDPSLFGDALRLLASASDVDIVLAGSPRERELLDRVAEACPSAISLAGETSLSELAALVERADLVIAQNSSSLHLADALRTPVVALYSGAEEVEQWRPRATPSVVLTRYAECAPCHQFTCPLDRRCLDIPPAEVAHAAVTLLRSSLPSTATDLTRVACSQLEGVRN